MLNRRILRIKVFKTLYASRFAENSTLAEAETRLDASCESVRDLYIFMLGIISPLTSLAGERLEAAKKKFNPTDEERNPNMKLVDNALAKALDTDPDFQKIFKKKKFSWEQYDIFLKKILDSIYSKEYYSEYMQQSGTSIADDCKFFIRVFEEEFVESEDLATILEDMSIYWNDDLAYSLTHVCRTLDSMAKGRRWELPLLYQSETMKGKDVQDDKAFARKLLRSGYVAFDKYFKLITESVPNWDNDRLVSTDVCLVVLGLAEAANFPEMPLKVTINEYVEIAKYYGTPKSATFVNGLLDKLIQKLIVSGEIVKQLTAKA